MKNIFYTDWIILSLSYYQLIKKKEIIFEFFFPLTISTICGFVYYWIDKVEIALHALSNILPSLASILIGFTVILITILLTSNGPSIERLKETKYKKKLAGKEVSLYQVLHICFCHLLIIEVLLLLSILFFLFLKGIGMPVWVLLAFLIIECFMTLSILLSIVRSIINLYFAFYQN